MKRVILIALFVAAAMGCRKDEDCSCNNIRTFITEATVIDGGDPRVDLCGWLIDINNEKVYAERLEEGFKIDNLRVRITYIEGEEPYFCGRNRVEFRRIIILKIKKI
jgi:lipoprotein